MRRTFNFLINLGDEITAKNVSVSFVIDLSGSMQGEPLEQVKNALSGLLVPMVSYNPDPNDAAEKYPVNQISLITFESQVIKVCPWLNEKDFDYFRECLLAVPEILFQRTGRTELYKALHFAFSDIAKNASPDNEKIIICFTDGCNYSVGNATENKAQLDQLIADQLIADQQGSSAKIYCLYYQAPGAAAGGLQVMEEYAKKTGGKVFSSPEPKDIPSVMKKIIDDIKQFSVLGIRRKLLRALKKHPHPEQGNFEWYRVFNINSITKNCIDAPPPGLRCEHHFISSLNLPETCSRNDAAGIGRGFFDHSYLNIQNVVLPQNLPGVSHDPYVTIVFRGNDVLGVSITKEIVDLLERMGNDQLFNYANVRKIVIILLDNYHTYTPVQKKQLFAQLNELYTVEMGGLVDNVIFLSEQNYDNVTQTGYNGLSPSEYEDLVTEVLLQLNYDQSLFEKIYGDALPAAGNYRPFLSIGALTLYEDLEKLIKHSAFNFSIDFLSKIFDEEALPPDMDAVKLSVGQFMSELAPLKLKQELSKSGENSTLLQALNAPEFQKLCRFSPRETLHFNRLNEKGDPIDDSMTVTYENEVEYLRIVLNDLREYVEAANNVKQIESIVSSRAAQLLEDAQTMIETAIDLQMYGLQTQNASPVQARKWIDECTDKIIELLDGRMIQQLGTDPEYQETQEFKFVTAKGTTITDSDVEKHFQDLKNEFENMFLTNALRVKYHSLSLALAGGALMQFLMFGMSFPFWITAPLPFISSFWGEKKFALEMETIKELMRIYTEAHRFKSRKRAYDILIANLSFVYRQLLKKLDSVKFKEKYPDEKDTVAVESLFIEDYSEKELIDLFEGSCNNYLARLWKSEQPNSEDSRFSLSLRSYIQEKHPALIPNVFPEGYTGCAEWRNEYETFKVKEEKIRIAKIPSVTAPFVPEDTSGIPPETAVKIKIERLLGNRCSRITIYDQLTENDKDNLKAVQPSPQWDRTIESLAAEFQRYDLTPLEMRQLLSLWRGVVNYQIWIEKLKSMIARQNFGADFDVDILFPIWKKVYAARKMFREKLFIMAEEKWQNEIEQNFSLWGSLISYKNLLAHDQRTEDSLFKQVINFSRPAIRHTGEGRPEVKDCYYSHEQNTWGRLREDYNVAQVDPVLSDLRITEELSGVGGLLDKYHLLFSSLNYFRIADSSLLKGIIDQSKEVFDSDELFKQYHLTYFADTCVTDEKRTERRSLWDKLCRGVE